MTTNQKWIIVAMLVLTLVVGSQIWTYTHRQQVNSDTTALDADPFANLTIPPAYEKDPATKAVIMQKIDGTKAMYKESPNIWETWIAIGNLRSLLQDYDGAIKAYQKSLEITHNNILAERNIAQIYYTNLQDYEKAAAHYRLAINNDFSSIDLYIELGNLYYQKLNKNEEAEKIFVEGLRRSSYNPELMMALIRFYKATGNIEKYRENAKIMLEKYPDNADYRRLYSDVVGL